MEVELFAIRQISQARQAGAVIQISIAEAGRLWLLRQASADPALSGWVKGWVCELHLLSADGFDARIWSLSLVTDPASRRCPTPVRSPAWLDLLGTGGGEDFNEALR